jgi:hypothetical protein
MARLKERAERKEAALFGRYRFANSADFFKRYLRLSAVLIRPAGAPEQTPPATLWVNKQAKHALPRPLQTILQRG